MKKLLLLFVCLFAFSTFSFADDKPISFGQLPERAKVFIKKHFPVTDVQKVFVDDEEYEVRLKTGVKIEFGKHGRWKEIESKKRPLPKSLVPAPILKDIRHKYGSSVQVLEISRDEDEVEVKLTNGKELKMDRKTKDVELDD